MGCHFLLQGIFSTRESNPVSALAGGFFTTSATWEAPTQTAKANSLGRNQGAGSSLQVGRERNYSRRENWGGSDLGRDGEKAWKAQQAEARTFWWHPLQARGSSRPEGRSRGVVTTQETGQGRV